MRSDLCNSRGKRDERGWARRGAWGRERPRDRAGKTKPPKVPGSIKGKELTTWENDNEKNRRRKTSQKIE